MKNGDATASACTVEHTSWAKPGKVSSAVRQPAARCPALPRPLRARPALLGPASPRRRGHPRARHRRRYWRRAEPARAACAYAAGGHRYVPHYSAPAADLVQDGHQCGRGPRFHQLGNCQLPLDVPSVPRRAGAGILRAWLELADDADVRASSSEVSAEVSAGESDGRLKGPGCCSRSGPAARWRPGAARSAALSGPGPAHRRRSSARRARHARSCR